MGRGGKLDMGMVEEVLEEEREQERWIRKIDSEERRAEGRGIERRKRGRKEGERGKEGEKERKEDREKEGETKKGGQRREKRGGRLID